MRARLPTHFTPQGARAGQHQHRQDVTQEAMDGVGTRERQSEDEDGVSGAGDDAHVVGGAHHVHTRSLAHQGGVMQLPADGSIAVTGHGREQAAFSDDREREVQLGEAAGGRDGGAGGEEVGQHPGHDGLGVEEPRRREVAQEEVHMGECRAASASVRRDQRVAQQGDPVDQKHPQTCVFDPLITQ